MDAHNDPCQDLERAVALATVGLAGAREHLARLERPNGTEPRDPAGGRSVAEQQAVVEQAERTLSDLKDLLARCRGGKSEFPGGHPA